VKLTSSRNSVNLDRLFNPASIALLGATPDSKKLSGRVAQFLKRSGYRGRVYAVNPRYQSIEDWPCYASLSLLPEPVDVLVCTVPVARALEAIDVDAARKVGYTVMMTGGFGEGMSGEAGKERLRE